MIPSRSLVVLTLVLSPLLACERKKSPCPQPRAEISGNHGHSLKIDEAAVELGSKRMFALAGGVRVAVATRNGSLRDRCELVRLGSG